MHGLVDYLAQLPVEWFVLIGAFVQELVSPLPSFVVFVPAGASVAAQHMPVAMLAGLALIAAVGRVVAALILYWLSDALRTRIYMKRKRWLGIGRRDIKRLEKRLTSSPTGSWWAVFALWAVPVMPGAIISLAGGFVRVPVQVFASATYAGAIINALTYLAIGYAGLSIVAPYDDAGFAGIAIFAVLVIVVAIYVLRRRK